VARKRRPSKAEQQFNTCAVRFFLTVLAMIPIVVIVDEARAHPLFGGLLAFLLMLGGGLYGVFWWRRREQQQIEAQRRAELRFQRSLAIAPYHEMSARDFENALAYLCERDGCTQVERVGGSGDLGADVKAIAPDGRLIVLQAKRYARTTKVSGPDLQKFGGTCFHVHGAHVAAVVTTSTFTKQAREYAQHMGIRLLDEHALAGWASRTGPAPWM
jgi:restriction system protein